MLYDRPYMKAPQPAREDWPVVKWILVANIAIYVLQAVSHRLLSGWIGAGALERFGRLEWEALHHGYLWTPFTYAWLHAPNNPFHLIFNMLGFYFLARTLKEEIGGKRLWYVYCSGIFLGGGFWLASDLIGRMAGWSLGPTALIGASAAVLAVMTLWCLRHWDEEMVLLLWFIVPVRIKPKYVLGFTLGIELFYFIFTELVPGPAREPIAHSAHLGGMLAGWIHYRLLNTRSLFAQPASPRRRERRTPVMASVQKAASAARRFRVNVSGREELRAEVDRILDKINEKGFGSLTDDEKQTLDRAREVLKERGN